MQVPLCAYPHAPAQALTAALHLPAAAVTPDPVPPLSFYCAPLLPATQSRAQNTEKIEFVATEHFWMSGMYWGLTAMHLLDRLHEMDQAAITGWVLSCQHANGGFGGSARNDPHLLYTLSAVQIMALFDKLDLLDAPRIAACESSVYARLAHGVLGRAWAAHACRAGCCPHAMMGPAAREPGHGLPEAAA